MSGACGLARALMALSERLGAAAGPPAISSTDVARPGDGGANPPRAVALSSPQRCEVAKSGKVRRPFACFNYKLQAPAQQTKRRMSQVWLCGGGARSCHVCRVPQGVTDRWCPAVHNHRAAKALAVLMEAAAALRTQGSPRSAARFR
jgi:hypothetical protein